MATGNAVIHMKTFFPLLAAVLSISFASAADWPQWMGEKRDGVWREAGIVKKFPEEGLKTLWRTPINGGYSGPAISGGKLYIMDRKPGPPLERKAGDRSIPALPGDERVACFDAATGALLWEQKYESRYRVDYPSGPRVTPLAHGGKVFTLGAMGDLLCLNADTGAVVWRKNFMEEYALPDPPVWGWAAQPLLDGNRLICLVGGTNSAVVAFDAHSGKELWRALTTKEIGYAPPVICEAAGKRQLIVWHPEAVVSLNPETGAAHWTQPYPAEGKQKRPEVTVAMPRASGDLLFLTSFYHGALMLKLDQERPGASVLWNRKSSSSSDFDAGLHTTMTTPVFSHGSLYGVCALGEFRALDAKTGDRLWETYEPMGGKKGLFATAFIVAHEDRHFIWNDQGELILARLSPEKYEEISRARLLDRSENARGREVVWSAPAFANKRFYARNQRELICVSLEDGKQG